MRYALLICTDESEVLSAEAAEARFKAYQAFSGPLEAEGVIVGSMRLQPTATATTVQVHDGDVVVADGPFAETKEQIAGFYVAECRDLDEAIAIAAKIPGAVHGKIEVRPVWEM
jgi:hypothetical protein